MCGICGVLSFEGPPDADLLRSMMSSLAHRGPDGSGYYRDTRVGLGHRRLSIIDLEGGTQPMCNEDGTVWVTFNGEIFNYVELTAQLRDRGHTFRTRSDTEVIVHAWEEWGPDAFRRFNGQWAVGIWDARRQRLVLSRDRLGVRPLYYTRTPNRLLFASEVKALFADPTVPRALDPEGVGEVLTFWSTVAPCTVFFGIRQLPPGCYLVHDTTGQREERYWQPQFPDQYAEPSQDVTSNAAELRENIVEATRLRFLRADVPVGAYLSGGIDSAVTASVIANYTDAPVHTFSLRFADREFDEGPYQRLMADRLGTAHEDVVVTPRDIANVFPEVVRHTETPVLRTAPAPLFLLSRLVRDSGYKVVVTGEGADEVLAGYDIFREARVRAFWARDPESPLRARAVELLYPWMQRSPTSTPAFARGFFGRNLDLDDPALSHRPRWDSTAVLKSMLTPEMQLAVGPDPAVELVAGMPGGNNRWDPLSRAQWLEMQTLLAGYILASQGDRMLMANSIEGRFPFLDANVVELANSLPARHKLLGLDEKHLLKRAFADLVPQEILHRPKQPYRAPDAAAFFSEGIPEWLAEVTCPEAVKDAGVFRPEQVARLFEKCQRTRGVGMSNTDNMRVVAVVSTQLLHHHFLEPSTLTGATSSEPPMAVFDQTTEGEHVIDTVRS